MGRCLLVFAMVLGLAAGSVSAADENPIVTLVKSKVKNPTKPFAIVVIFKVKAGEEKSFVEAFKPAIAATRKEPGCVAYILNHNVEHPEQYAMYEQFKNVAALEEHAKQPYIEKLLPLVLSKVEAPPEVKVYEIEAE